jgi:protein-disulfide isomerase
MRNAGVTRLCTLGGVLGALLMQAASSDPYFRQMQPPRHAMPSEAKLAFEDVRGPLAPPIGPAAAAVTIIVFSDYYCPFCGTLANTLADLHKTYPEQVRIVYRHFATSEDGKVLSQAALCAAEQESFAEYHRGVFLTQGTGQERISQFVAEARLDGDELARCVESGRYVQRVEDDIREGERLNVQVTPTLFVNGRRIAGAASYEILTERVAESLR